MSNSRLFQYFEDELAYLASAGPKFAKKHPERAALVSLDNVTSRDPDVERLVQAFAFLAGQVRAELHNELPELTHCLVQLLWPHYLQMIPATTTVEFLPDVDQLSNRTTILCHEAYVESSPITSFETGKDIACPFRNCFDVDLYPLTLRHVEVERNVSASALMLTFELGPNAEPYLDWRDLRLHLGGDPVTALEMRRWLLRHVVEDAITAEVPVEGHKPKTVKLGTIEPVGFAPNEAVLVYPHQSFPGYRLVQEYFTLKHKFLYVDLCGMDTINPVVPGSTFVVKIPLTDHPPGRMRFDTETIRIHCSPVVNLFRAGAVPIRYDGRRAEYEILADHDSQAYSIYRVLRVFGQIQGQAKVTEYQSFLSFRAQAQAGEPYYHVSVRPGADDRLAWRLSLISPSEVLPPQLISMELECCNGALPVALLPGDIRHRSTGVPDTVRVRNLSQPEGMLSPPLESGSVWRFISHLALNYLTLADADSLVAALKLYDWTKGNVNWRRLQGIRNLSTRSGCTIVEGVPLRGRDVTVELDIAAFTNEGDAYLFAEVLRHFLALYANINSYVRLTCRFSNGVEICWPAMNGRQQPI